MGVFDKASLALVPDGIKDGKLYSIKPTDGSGDFTFSRGSNLAATRVNENGLIEKGRENLLLQSNQFDTTWVAGSNLTVTSGQSDRNGTNAAWLLSKSSSNRFIYQDLTSSGVQTYSVYIKAGTSSWVRLVANTSNFKGAYFDLSNGATGYIENSIDATIESVGNDWYRCSVIFEGAVTRVRIYPAEQNSTDGTTGSIYIQDAQLEQGLVATDYIETGATTAQAGILEYLPRIDYTGGTPSLLMEPSRTNLMRYSEYFGGWSAIGTPTRTPNAATSPEGLTNAYSLSNTSGSTARIRNTNLVATSGDKFVVSIFAKENAASTFEIRHQTSSYISVVFDLSDESYTGGGSWVDDVDFIDYGSGWYRCLIYFTAGATATGTIEIELANNDSIYAYGFMAESGSYATSYIPTYSTTAVTRSEDRSTSGTISNVTEGVLFFEGSVDKNEDTIKLIEFNDGTLNNRIFLYYRDSTGTLPRLYAFATSGGTQVYGYVYDIPSGKGEITHKVAFRFADNDFALFYNGTKVDSQTSGTISTNPKNQVMYETSAGAIPFRGNVKQTIVFPEALSDAECITLTT